MRKIKKIQILLFFFVLSFCIGCYIDVPVESDENSQNIEIKKWKNGIIYFYFKDSFSIQEEELIIYAMKIWEKETPILFIEENKKNSLKIYKKDVARATVGDQDNNYLYLPDEFNQRIIFHELGHVIGLRHEHQRIDRDKYINILWENILSQKKDEFKKIHFELYNHVDYEYDFNSIMHYSFYDFSKNFLPTIKYAKKDGFYLVRLKPSEIDYQKVRDIYR